MIRHLSPALIELAISWAEKQAALILRDGMPLDADKTDLARSAGVAYPERIRLLQVTRIPLPDDQQLTRMATVMGFPGSGLAGLTLGYGIYLRQGYGAPQILSHEFRHVHQYEQAGGIDAFLSEYLRQIAQYGYANAPLEMDARTYGAREAVTRDSGEG